MKQPSCRPALRLHGLNWSARGPSWRRLRKLTGSGVKLFRPWRKRVRNSISTTKSCVNLREASTAAIGEADKMRSDIEAASRKTLDLQAKLANADANLGEATKLRSDLQKARTQITSLTASTATTRKQFDSMQDKVKSAAEQIASLKADRKAALAELSVATKARDEAVQSLATAEAAKAQKDKALAQANETVQTAAAGATGLRGSLKGANARILTLETGLKEAAAAAAKAQGLQADLQKAQDQIASLKSTRQAVDGGTEALEGKLQSVTQQRDALAAKSKAAKAKLAASVRAQETAAQSLAKAQDALRASSTEADKLRGQLDGDGKKTAALEVKLGSALAAAAKADELDKKLQAAKSQLDVLAADNKAALAKLGGIRTG